jgi:hypothetical protein
VVEWSWRADWEETSKRLRMEFEPTGTGTNLRATSQADYSEQMEADDRQGLSEILGWFALHCSSIK